MRKRDARLIASFIAIIIVAIFVANGMLGSELKGSTRRGAGFRGDYRIEPKEENEKSEKQLARKGKHLNGTGEPQNIDSSKKYYLVKKAVDGDTVRLENGEKVRLIGVDTPETKHPKKDVQCFGKNASEYTKKMLYNKYVWIERDREYRDKYGRLLAYLYRKDDNIMHNLELVELGYGFAYTRFPFKYKEAFVKAEKEARAKGLGLWNACSIDDFK